MKNIKAVIGNAAIAVGENDIIRDGKMLYSLEETHERNGKLQMTNRLYMNVEGQSVDNDGCGRRASDIATDFAEFIEVFTPEHVALMHKVTEAARDIANWHRPHGNDCMCLECGLWDALFALKSYKSAKELT